MPTPYLEIISAEGSQRRELGAKALTIGRHTDNLIVITDEQASRYHCVVEKAGDGFRVRDLKSKNGTRVNDVRIESAMLKPGDTIQVGKIQFHYVAAEGAEAENQPKGAPRASSPAAAARAASAAPTGFRAGAARQNIEATVPASSAADDDDVPSIFDEAPRMEVDEAAPVIPGNERDRSMHSLKQLADSTADRSFTENEIKLVNARGETMRAVESGKSEDDDSAAVPDGIRILRLLFLACFRARATDLHLEPKNDDYVCRFRVDGGMVEAAHIDKKSAALLNGVVKILCDIDVGIRQNIIQEGHFSVGLPDRRVDYRVSFTPSMYGQKLVIRVLDLANAPKYLNDLEMPDWMLQAIRRVARQDAGMILVAGPTGSGKTTTLYTVLRDIDVQTRNVVTIEDPVEYQISGVTQIPIDEFKGNTFSTLLRSVLRQDPDVILLGEIRDKETAMTAMQAAMTGHLVFSTVHAKDTIGTIFRILDLGIEPYLVASALNLVLAQRLLRVLCPFCKEEKKPTPQQTIKMGRAVEGLAKIWLPVGCPKCLNTGFAGRRGVFELLQVSDDIRDVILKNPTIQAIRESVKLTVFTPLQRSGFKLVADGITSMDEVERVTGMD